MSIDLEALPPCMLAYARLAQTQQSQMHWCRHKAIIHFHE